MEIIDFLRSVITTEEGYFCLAYARIKGSERTWSEEFYKWPTQQTDIINRIAELSKSEVNIYFSPHLFKTANSKKENVLPTRTIVADLDEANVLTIHFKPTILVQTSVDRHQAYWIIKDDLDTETFEQFSKRMTYSIPRCDTNGWFLGKKVRVPNTINTKYLTGNQFVKVVDASNARYTANDLDNLPTVEMLYGVEPDTDLDWVEAASKLAIGPQELLNKIRGTLPARVVAQYNIRASDRSTALWALMMSAFRSGLDREHVYHLAYNSANNKFLDLRYGGARELAKDVLRAQLEATSKLPDIKSKIRQARSLTGSYFERARYLADLVRDHMSEIGTFVHTDLDEAWYIRSDTGKPIQLSGRSHHLQTMIESLFGLNATEKETSYIIQSLISHVNEMPAMGRVSTLTHFDVDSKTLLIHTGRKNVLRVNAQGIQVVDNGYDGVVFPWNVGSSTINPKYSALEQTWADALFDGCLDNVLDLPTNESKAILRVWFLCVLLRDALIARPILALLGQPGCLSGDTKLQIRRGEHSAREYTLNELYYKHVGHIPGQQWDINIPTRIRSEKNGIITWCTIKRFIASGKRETFTVRVAGHEPFRVTKDHRFLTPSGYRKLEDLSIGDIVTIQGQHLTGKGKSATWRPEVSAKYHPHARERLVYGYGPYRFIQRYRAVIEARMNGLSLDEYKTIIHTNEHVASQLMYLNPNVHIHHLDENPLNDEYDNLQVIDKLSHDTHHGHKNVRNFGYYSGLFYVAEAPIEEISLYGEEQTYDIEMEDEEAPNFIVNGVVVHNSGKSTLMRRVYALMYGRDKAVSAITKEDNFDHAVSKEPLVVLDNVDSFARWLPDRLALSASTSEIVKRKLFTDTDTVVVRRQSMLALTAHNPKFGREDVTDRLLILTFERLQHFVPESDIIDRIIRMRDSLWGAVLSDIQQVFTTPMPSTGWPQFRIEDFARFGYWIATALGIATDFCDGLERIRREQKIFAMSDDELLIIAIGRLIERNKGELKWYAPGQLFNLLEPLSPDSRTFNATYKNAMVLGKKLWTLQDALNEVYEVRFENDTHAGSRKWSFMLKPNAVTEKEVLEHVSTTR